MPRIRSTPPGAQHKSRAREPDHRGDHRGIIEPAPADGHSQRDAVVSIRWVALAMRQTARDLADPLDEDEPDDGVEFADRLDDAARRIEHSAAMWRAFRLLWRALDHRVSAGMVIDAADLYVGGRGSIEHVVAGLVGGRFDDLPRDDEGFLIGIWD
jgi:hypothetical protein